MLKARRPRLFGLLRPRLLAAAALLACSQQAAALSAGAPRGTALIGRPLQLDFGGQLDGSVASRCGEATLVQGESPGGPLRWQLERDTAGGAVLGLTLPVPVLEPVVTAQLALGRGPQYPGDSLLPTGAPLLRNSAQLGKLPSTRGAPTAVVAGSPAEQAALTLKFESEPRAMRELAQRQGAHRRLLADRPAPVSGGRAILQKALFAFFVLSALGCAYLLWLRSRETVASRAWWEHENTDPANLARRQAVEESRNGP